MTIVTNSSPDDLYSFQRSRLSDSAGRSGVRIRVGMRGFPYVRIVQAVTGAPSASRSEGIKWPFCRGQSVKPTAHLHLVSRLSMSAVVPLLVGVGNTAAGPCLARVILTVRPYKCGSLQKVVTRCRLLVAGVSLRRLGSISGLSM